MRGLRFFRLELLGGRIGSKSGHGRAGHRGCWRMLRAFQGTVISGIWPSERFQLHQKAVNVTEYSGLVAAFRMQLSVCRVWE